MSEIIALGTSTQFGKVIGVGNGKSFGERYYFCTNNGVISLIPATTLESTTARRKRLFKIPLRERIIQTVQYGDSQEYMELDGIGFLLVYSKEKRKSMTTPEFEDFIRHHLTMAQSTHCLVEAENIEEAKAIFEREWEGAQIGTKSKAIVIQEEEYDKIREIPFCSLRHKNKRGDYICGEPANEEDDCNGDFGMCAIEGYDCPEDCPMEVMVQCPDCGGSGMDMERFDEFLVGKAIFCKKCKGQGFIKDKSNGG